MFLKKHNGVFLTHLPIFYPLKMRKLPKEVVVTFYSPVPANPRMELTHTYFLYNRGISLMPRLKEPRESPWLP